MIAKVLAIDSTEWWDGGELCKEMMQLASSCRKSGGVDKQASGSFFLLCS